MTVSLNRLVLGIPIQFDCESEQITSAIAQIYPVIGINDPQSAIHLTINHSRDNLKPFSIPAQIEVDDLNLVGRSGVNYFSADRKALTGVAFLCPKMLKDEYMLRHQILNALCYYLLTYQYYLPVHAACIKLKHFQVLCLGSSGVGKSTLAMAALRRRLPVISEDLCFIGATQELGIKADCRELHLYHDSYARFNSATNNKLVITHSGKQKHLVPNRFDSSLTIESSNSIAKVLVLFLTASHARKETCLNAISSDTHFDQLLRPKEEGFNLLSHARRSAVNWLQTQPCFEGSIGYCFDSFFARVNQIQEELTCVIP